jgi:hypothetical protein
MVDIVIGVRGHRGEPLVITPAVRCEHVLDALFDDPFLAGLRRVELTSADVILTFGAAATPERDVVRTRVTELLGPPRWVVDPTVRVSQPT